MSCSLRQVNVLLLDEFNPPESIIFSTTHLPPSPWQTFLHLCHKGLSMAVNGPSLGRKRRNWWGYNLLGRIALVSFNSLNALRHRSVALGARRDDTTVWGGASTTGSGGRCGTWISRCSLESTTGIRQDHWKLVQTPLVMTVGCSGSHAIGDGDDGITILFWGAWAATSTTESGSNSENLA